MPRVISSSTNLNWDELSLGEESISDIDEYEPRYDHRNRKAKHDPNVPHTFVLWDGEGITFEETQHKIQSYVLLGCFDGLEHSLIKGKHLKVEECFRFIIETEEAQRAKGRYTWHVAFAFGYDVNMICKSLPVRNIVRLVKKGTTRYMQYMIQYVQNHWFRVTDMTKKITVTIYDVWAFFQSSLVVALKSNIPDHPLMVHLAEIEQGKDKRGAFTWEDIDYVERYWRIENELGHALVTRLKAYLYENDLRITKWYGPGAIANYVFKREKVHNSRANTGPAVYDASRYAYAGGRFEVFRIGRHLNVFSYDINSAYPEAISRLPSLAEGTWTHHIGTPDEIAYFGMYFIESHKYFEDHKADRTPVPFFHRDTKGNITYQNFTAGWYWSPEIQAAIDTGYQFDILEYWEYTGWKSYPFEFVEDMYETRRAMKAAGNGSQMALKLALNSLYGKMAQRAGWERDGKAPKWHQLEWAGWVTSYARAKLYRLIYKIPWGDLIAVETDGLFATCSPDLLGISNSGALGGWKVDHFDEMVYLQSGLYAVREGSNWTTKYRGLDRDSLSASRIVEHSRKLLPHNRYWEPIEGTTKRFVGMKLALFRQERLNQGPLKFHLGRWETEKREVAIGSQGKRKHIGNDILCDACVAGQDGYHMAHDLVAVLHNPFLSQPHDIPWLNPDIAIWRERASIDSEVLSQG